MGPLTLFTNRMKVVLATMTCREAWTVSPRVAAALFKSLQFVRPVTAPTGTFLYPNIPAAGSKVFGRYLNGLKRLSRGERVVQAAHVSVTDRCGYRCPRCSNVSAPANDPPLESIRRTLSVLKAAGVASVAFTGGEPLLREDLADIVALCGDALSATVLTSGHGLDAAAARHLRSAGLSALHVSIDHYVAGEHDRGRGADGAFAHAVRAVAASLDAGLYTAIQAVVDPPLLEGGQLNRFLDFCTGLHVHEVVLLEPVPIRLDAPCAVFDEPTRERLSDLHRRAARDGSLPKITAAPFLEGPEFLGCQAGLSFVYVGTSGEVFPCDLAPASFGNVHSDGFEAIMARLGRVLKSPSRKCLGIRLRELAGQRPFPLHWPDAEAILSGYDPGEPPDLARRILSRSR